MNYEQIMVYLSNKKQVLLKLQKEELAQGKCSNAECARKLQRFITQLDLLMEYFECKRKSRLPFTELEKDEYVQKNRFYNQECHEKNVQKILDEYHNSLEKISENYPFARFVHFFPEKAEEFWKCLKEDFSEAEHKFLLGLGMSLSIGYYIPGAMLFRDGFLKYLGFLTDKEMKVLQKAKQEASKLTVEAIQNTGIILHHSPSLLSFLRDSNILYDLVGDYVLDISHVPIKQRDYFKIDSNVYAKRNLLECLCAVSKEYQDDIFMVDDEKSKAIRKVDSEYLKTKNEWMDEASIREKLEAEVLQREPHLSEFQNAVFQIIVTKFGKYRIQEECKKADAFIQAALLQGNVKQLNHFIAELDFQKPTFDQNVVELLEEELRYQAFSHNSKLFQILFFLKQEWNLSEDASIDLPTEKFFKARNKFHQYNHSLMEDIKKKLEHISFDINDKILLQNFLKMFQKMDSYENLDWYDKFYVFLIQVKEKYCQKITNLNQYPCPSKEFVDVLSWLADFDLSQAISKKENLEKLKYVKFIISSLYQAIFSQSSTCVQLLSQEEQLALLELSKSLLPYQEECVRKRKDDNKPKM